MQTEMLIGSKLQKGKGEAEAVLNPKTGKAIAKVKEATPGQVETAVTAATKAFHAWSRTTPGQRAGLMLKLADRIEAEADDFAALEALNCGKPLNAVKNDEMPAIVDCLRFFAGAARVMPGSAAAEYLPGFTSMIRRDPIGVVGSITPWNYPLMMAIWKISPALMAGNTMVLKPSEMTPLTTLKLAALIADIFPEGVFNVVVGRGATTGNALINHPRVAMLSLTGSIATGQRVLEAAARSIKRTHLELGGKAPVVVFDDADLDAVVSGLKAFSFYNAGQDCTAASRIYAGKGIYEKLVADLSSAAASIRYNRKDDAENEIGPLISAKHRERVSGFVDRAAKTKHAEVVTGGQVACRQGLLLRADRRRRRHARRRDRAQRGVRAGRLRHPLHRCRRGGRVGERFRLRPRLLRLDQGRGACHGRRRAASIRLHLGELPLHAGERDAAWRREAFRLRQGHVGLRAGGLHRRAARHGEARMRRRRMSLPP